MTLPPLFAGGSPLRIGRRLGRGGEGDVFLLDDGSDRAVKYYTVADLAEREAKVRAMVRGGLAAKSGLVAFPTATVQTRDGRFVGFLMRCVSGHKPLFELYSPAARKRQFPDADFRFLARTATNVARAVAAVHDSGCVIGDINHSGILISEKATAALIDADSFQYIEGGTRHACRVGVPEYTPPELQGSSLRDVVRTRAHDEFGLAVVVFQLLFLGRHPYAGAYAGAGDMPIQKAIGEHRFAYSRQRQVGMSPPPFASTLDDVPDEIAAAFEAAFGRNPATRPTAERWTSALANLERHLKRCGSNSGHYYASTASRCPWCRMEQGVGVVLFPTGFKTGTAADVGDPGASSFDLLVVWAAIEAVRIPPRAGIQPPSFVGDTEVSSDAKAVLDARRWRRLVGAVALVAAAATIYLAINLWLLWVALALFGLHHLFMGPDDGRPALDRYVKAVADWDDGVEAWRDRCGLGELESLKATLSQARAQYRDLPARQKAKRERFQSERRDRQLKAHLERHQIRQARVDGVGTALAMQLVGYGIETAADVIQHRILQVPGFGTVKTAALVAWRRRVEAKFTFSANPTPADQAELARLNAELNAEAGALRRRLAGGAEQLKAAVANLEVRASAPDAQLARLFGAMTRREADLLFLNIQKPAFPSSPRPAHPAPTAHLPNAGGGIPPVSGGPGPPSLQRPASANNTTCPRCSRVMVLRTARRGRNAGNLFWGCPSYPSCTGTRPI